MQTPPRSHPIVDALAEILAGAFDARGLRGFLVGEPRGPEILRLLPRRASVELLARHTARLLAEIGIDNALLARLASARPGATSDIASLAVALREAGHLAPTLADQIQTPEVVPPSPTLIAGHRKVLAAVLEALRAPGVARVALRAPDPSQAEGLLGALVREEARYEAAPGGVALLAPRAGDDLAAVLRAHGLAAQDPVLAFATELRDGRARMAALLGPQSLLILLDRGAEPALLRSLAACVGEGARVLVVTVRPEVARALAGTEVVVATALSPGLAEDVLSWWAWGADGAETTLKAIATALPREPETLELAGRVMAGPPPLLEPGELLASLVILRSHGHGVGRQALVDRVLTALPEDDRLRVLALGIYGPDAVLDRQLVGAAWDRAPRAAVVRSELRNLAEFGLVRRLPDGRWQLPAVVYEGCRRWRERNGAPIRAAIRTATAVLVPRLAALLRAWSARELPELAAGIRVREPARGLWREAYRWGRTDPRVTEVCATLATLPADFLAWLLPAEEALMWAEGTVTGAAASGAQAVESQLRVARVARALGRLDHAEQLYHAVCARHGADQPRVLFELGRIQHERGQGVAARVQLEDALRRAEAAGDRALVVEICELLGEVCQLMDDRLRARALFQQALGAVGPVAPVRARLRLQIGELHLADGNVADATEQLVKAGRLANAAQQPLLEARAARALAACARSKGRVVESLTWLRQAQRALEGGGDVTELLRVLRELAELESERGKVREALALHRRRGALLRASGDWVGAARALVDLGVLMEREDCLDEAMGLFTSAVVVARKADDAQGQARALLAAGRLFLTRDNLTSALIDLEAAALLARDCGWSLGEASCLWRISRIERRLGQVAASLLHAREAQRVGRSLDATGQFEVRLNLVEAMAAVGQRGTAITEVRSMLDGRADGAQAGRLRRLLALWEAPRQQA